MLPKALKRWPKSNKSPNLVTLDASITKTISTCLPFQEIVSIFCLILEKFLAAYGLRTRTTTIGGWHTNHCATTFALLIDLGKMIMTSARLESRARLKNFSSTVDKILSTSIPILICDDSTSKPWTQISEVLIRVTFAHLLHLKLYSPVVLRFPT